MSTSKSKKFDKLSKRPRLSPIVESGEEGETDMEDMVSNFSRQSSLLFNGTLDYPCLAIPHFYLSFAQNFNGNLPKNFVARKKKQDMYHKKREQQCKDLKKNVKASKPLPPVTPPTRSSAEEKLVDFLVNEEDRFTHFALSLVQPLRGLPASVSRSLLNRFMSILTEAEGAAEEQSRYVFLGSD